MGIRISEKHFGKLYVVADIHGCISELEVILKYLLEEKNFSEKDQLVFLGDYIDRGDGSVKVINRLLELQKTFPKTIFLRGNHESMFLSYLKKGGNNGDAFIYNGGQQTLIQYEDEYGCDEFGKIKIPDEHINFLTSTEMFVETDDFLIVHAGFFPEVPLTEQTEDDMTWIRGVFFNNPYSFDKPTIVGHTVQEKFNKKNNGNIWCMDLGCVYKKRLPSAALACLDTIENKLYKVFKDTTEIVVEDLE